MCKCSKQTNFTETFNVQNTPLGEEINSINTLVSDIEIPSSAEEISKSKDLMLHKFSGHVNNVPLETAKLYSTALPTVNGVQKRRFQGKLANEDFDYTMSASYEGDIIKVTLDLNMPEVPELEQVSYKYDTKNNWLISSYPDVLDFKKPPILGALSPAQTMVFLAQAKPQQWDWHCLLHVIIHVGGLCAWVFAGGGPNPLTVAAYIACAGPGIMAALIGCKK